MRHRFFCSFSARTRIPSSPAILAAVMSQPKCPIIEGCRRIEGADGFGCRGPGFVAPAE